MELPVLLSLLGACCFGAGMITSRIGLHHLEARTGAAISIPSATVLFVALAPFTVERSGLVLAAAAVFAAVGLFYPAMVTLLTFRSNEELGPTVTSAISGTAPLFAIAAAAWLLGEQVPVQAFVAAIAVAVGVALLSWQPGALESDKRWPLLLWPVTGALIRGLAQTGAKAGLLLWPNPFAASVIGYLVSSAAVLGAEQWRSGGRRRITRRGFFWFVLTGLINGSALALTYSALAIAPVSTVAPIIAAYPLITALGSAVFLRTEKISGAMVAGTLITVCAIAWLAGFRA